MQLTSRSSMTPAPPRHACRGRQLHHFVAVQSRSYFDGNPNGSSDHRRQCRRPSCPSALRRCPDGDTADRTVADQRHLRNSKGGHHQPPATDLRHASGPGSDRRTRSHVGRQERSRFSTDQHLWLPGPIVQLLRRIRAAERRNRHPHSHHYRKRQRPWKPARHYPNRNC